MCPLNINPWIIHYIYLTHVRWTSFVPIYITFSYQASFFYTSKFINLCQPNLILNNNYYAPLKVFNYQFIQF